MSPGIWSRGPPPGTNASLVSSRHLASERHDLCFFWRMLVGTAEGIGSAAFDRPECDEAAQQAESEEWRVRIGQVSARRRATGPETSVWCRRLPSRPVHRNQGAGRDEDTCRSADDPALRFHLRDAQPDRRRHTETKGGQDVFPLDGDLGWTSVQPWRFLRRLRRLGLYCRAEGSLARSRVVRTATASSSGRDTRHGRVMSCSTAIAWAHAGDTVIATGLAGNGGTQGGHASWWKPCRVISRILYLPAAHRGGEECRGRGLNRVCCSWKSGRGSLVWPERPSGSAPDPACPLASLGCLRCCHNSDTGTVACVASGRCNRSAHYSFCSAIVTPNPLSGLTTIVWTVSVAAWRAPASAGLTCSSHVRFDWILYRIGVQDARDNMPKLLHRL